MAFASPTVRIGTNKEDDFEVKGGPLKPKTRGASVKFLVGDRNDKNTKIVRSCIVIVDRALTTPFGLGVFKNLVNLNQMTNQT